MRRLLLKGAEQVSLEEVPIPQISDDEVLVEVKVCGICGTDLHAFLDGMTLSPGTYLGHEFSGVINKAGKNIKNWRVGDRVVVNPMYMCGKCYACLHGQHSACQHFVDYALGIASGEEYAGAFAKYIRVPSPDSRLHLLPDNLSFEEGALVEPLACSLHAVRKSAFMPRGRVMVLGAGTIGLGIIAHLSSAGAGLIIASELVDQRIKLAKEFGADYVFNPQKDTDIKEKVLELTRGVGVDVVFDSSGIEPAFRSATSFLRKGGQLLLKGVIAKDVPVFLSDWVFNEWSLQSSMCYYSDEFPMVIEFLSRKKLPVEKMITSKIKLSKILEDGLQKLTKPNHKEIKVLVEPDI